MAEENAKKKGAVWKPLAIVFMILTIVLLAALAGVVILMPKGATDSGGSPLITVGSSNLELCLSMKENTSDLQTSLTVDGMQGQDATTFAFIPSDITQGIGNKSDTKNRTYFAFSFYLINRSERDVSYEMTVNVSENSSQALLNAVRVMVIEGEKSTSEGDIYARPEASDEARNHLAEKTEYTTQPFVSNTVVCKRQSSGLEKDGKIKQTLVVWIEGNDMDCNDSILATSLTMDLSITAY